jgi:hypothetical protein
MAKNAVVSDYGDAITVDMNVDLTSHTALALTFTAPDGTVTTKVDADGVTDNSDPTGGLIAYTIETGLLDQDGDWLVSGKLTTSAGVFSSPVPAVYTVTRRNQSS